MRPLALDLLDILVPLAVGALSFLVGKSFRRLPVWLRFGSIAVALAIVALGGLSLARMLPLEATSQLSRFGGSTTLLAWIALFLLGVVWNVPGRSFSSGFLVALALLAGCLIIVDSSGRVWWRYAESQTWQRFPDQEGRLQQSSGVTCSPAAAAMLLHRYGIRASEGELAYLAATSLFGTDGASIARALQQKAESLGWQAVVRQTDYAAVCALGKPFIAHVSGSSAGHALLVLHADQDRVEILDPATGLYKVLSSEDFRRIWDGTAVYLESSGN